MFSLFCLTTICASAVAQVEEKIEGRVDSDEQVIEADEQGEPLKRNRKQNNGDYFA